MMPTKPVVNTSFTALTLGEDILLFRYDQEVGSANGLTVIYVDQGARNEQLIAHRFLYWMDKLNSTWRFSFRTSEHPETLINSLPHSHKTVLVGESTGAGEICKLASMSPSIHGIMLIKPTTGAISALPCFPSILVINAGPHSTLDRLIHLTSFYSVY